MEMRFASGALAVATGMGIGAGAADPLLHWDLEVADGRSVVEKVHGGSGTLEGNHTVVEGVRGKAIRLDGYTSVVISEGGGASPSSGSVTTEAWIALGAYPWNWCPVVAQRNDVAGGKDHAGGFSMEIGPRGELGFRIFIEGNEILCVSGNFAVGLFEWTHVAASYEEGEGMKVFINGRQVGNYQIKGGANYAAKQAIRIGMNRRAVNPSNLIGKSGYKPFWYSLDGIIDEVKIHNVALTGDDFRSVFSSQKPESPPALPERKLPVVNQDRPSFGAYYTKLRYYKEWDQLWPVESDPDLVVTFRDSPVKMVFWRGTRYSPAWVTDNNLWMTDQSVESWNDTDGCIEHMQDPHCRYSHVRLIEDHAARKVIHWRYAPVSAYNGLWREHPKTGWGVWIDEYYYVYPDATAIRKVCWNSEALGQPVQFQETMPLTGPGQTRGDVMETDYLTVANAKGETLQLHYRESPEAIAKERIPEEPNIQRHNFKSDYDPFIIFEPGNRMNYIMDRDVKLLDLPGSCNHWPVGQPNCDGRVAQASDRPASFLGFPISDPVVHDGPNGRSHLNSIYGMTNMPIVDLVQLSGSWSKPPVMNLTSKRGGMEAAYDRSQKAYVVRSEKSAVDGIRATIGCSEASPLFNPALVIEGWGEVPPEIVLNGKVMEVGKDFSFGYEKDINRTDLVVWIKTRSAKPVTLEVNRSR